MSRPKLRQEVDAYLEWWRDAGAGDGVGEIACDWFALERPPIVAPAVPPALIALRRSSEPTPPSPTTNLPPVLDLNARNLVSGAQTLDDLQALLQAFEGCGLKATAKNLCFYRGAAQSRLMLIGEAPGRDEDLAGKPFVGRAGQLLDRMLAAIGLTEATVHITNTVYWRPPGNRTPTPEETLACAPFLARQMELVNPQIVVLLGGVAAKAVLGVTDGILKLRGKWRTIAIAGAEVKAVATLHPAYLLRTPAAKRQAWQDLLMIQKALQD